MLRSVTMALVLALLLAWPAFGDWAEPVDKKISEGQLKTYLDTAVEWADINAKVMEAVSGATTEAQRLAAVGDIAKKRQDCLDRHHISEAEFSWVGQRTSEAWGIATYLDDTYAKAEADLQARMKENDQKQADAQQKLETYQAAEKDGVRVLSVEDRDAAIKAAKTDLEASQNEVKQHTDEVLAAENDVVQHDADARTADDLAKNPPTTVAAEDRDSYVQGQKDAAGAARGAAKDARDRLADLKKALAEAQGRVEADGPKIQHPEIPATADDKALAKAENEAAIAQAQANIEVCKQTKTQLAMTESQMKKSADDMAAKAPGENVDLMRKYSTQYKALLEKIARGGATTAPSH